MAERVKLSGRGAPRKVTRERVLETAARQINRRGVRTTLLRDVAGELGVARMTIYQHADDRDDLVFRCYQRTCEVLETSVGEARQARAGAIAKLKLLLASLLGPRAPEMCAIVEPGLLAVEKRTLVEQRFDAAAQGLASLLQEGAAEREVRACAFEPVARAIINMTFWAPLASLWNRTQLDGARRSVLQAAEDLLLDGWSADRAIALRYKAIDLAPLSASVSDAFDRTSVGDAKREQILSTASFLFNRQGVDSTTLEQIAESLGATPRALYHNVGDKQTIVAECYFRMMRMAIQLQRAAFSRPETKLISNTAFQHAWARTQMRRELSPLMPLTGFETLRAEHQRRFHDYGIELTNVTLAHLHAGVADRSIRPLGRHAMRLQAGVLGWLARANYPEGEQEQIAREAAALLALGVRALPAHA